MKKEFKKIENIGSVLIKKAKRIILVAGITFTLFSTNVAASFESSFSLSPVSISITKEVTPDPASNIKVALKSTIATSSDLMWESFNNFQKSAETDCKNIKESFAKIVDALNDIKFSKIAVDGNPEEDRLKVAFRLPNNVILSIIKEQGVHLDDYVGVNIFRNRQLLISDIMELSLLKTYISNVQARLQG